jgi:hypothetical protein
MDWLNCFYFDAPQSKYMNDYTINVTQVEEYQNINNVDALETIFARAKSSIVNGAKVILVRKESSGRSVKFDEMDTLEELEKYKVDVFKYL